MKLQRSISSTALLLTSVGCMVGSGWLFGAYYAARIAGPAAIFSWLLGGILILFIALTFAELSSMLPIAGGIARYSQFTHGTLVSFCVSWLAWLSCVAVAPTEVQAILQYCATYFPWLVYEKQGIPVLTMSGLGIATLMMFFISFLNVLGVKLLTRYNSFITWWKLLIPLIVIYVIYHTHFNAGNFSELNHLSAHDLHGILWALPTAGIVFSFLGFREATSMAGEAQSPGRAIPIAVIGSVLICTLLYILIQTVFVGSLSPSMLANGWSHLNFTGDSGPFAGIATSLGLGALVLLIYADSMVSPFGTGLIYTATTARLNYAMSVNKYTPQFMLKLNERGVPAKAVMLNFAVGMLMFMPLPTWQALVGFQSTAIVMAYGIGPIALLTLRRQAPDLHRPFKLPASKLMCAITFCICNLISYWTGWETVWRLMFGIVLGLIVLFIYRKVSHQKDSLNLKTAFWLVPYFLGLAAISYFGSFGGGKEVIPFGWDFLVVAVFSLIILLIAFKFSLNQTDAQALLDSDEELKDLPIEGVVISKAHPVLAPQH